MDFRNSMQKAPTQDKDNHLEAMKALGEIGALTKKILSHLEHQTKAANKMITLVNGSPFTFRDEGYIFNSLFVSDAQVSDAAKIKVSVDGLDYTVTLAAGENRLNIPDGAELTLSSTSKVNYSFSLWLYNINKG